MSSDEMQEPILSLELLESELVRVLYDRNDTSRLAKAKTIIERYSGVDWIAYQQCPVMDGYELSGYQRVGVKKHNDLFDLLVLSWAPGTQSPIHDHPCERCYLMCVSGDMYEKRYNLDSDGSVHERCENRIPPRVATWISDDMGLHAVGNNGSTLACSLHCYVPGFTTPCRVFDSTTGAVTHVSAIPKSCQIPNLTDMVFLKAKECLSNYDDPKQAPVLHSKKRVDIENAFKNQRCSIDFAVDSKPLDDQAIRRALDSVCDLSVHTGHLYYFNQLLTKSDDLASSVEALTSALNINMYNFENAPVLTLMERALLQHLATFLGWCDSSKQKTRSNSSVSDFNDETFDGIVLPGASLCNLVALHAARTSKFPDSVTGTASGMAIDMVVLTSEESHCSIEKACMMLGLGRDACVYVKCDPDTGCVNVDAMEQKIIDLLKGQRVPFFINCTSGSTHSGAFDDCAALYALAQKYNIWLHVDGALGASFLLPQEDPFKTLVNGISDADSISWNIHKILGVPLPCSVLLTRHPRSLCDAYSTTHQDQRQTFSYTPWLDNGSKSILSSRRADAFKAWVLWKKLGDVGMANKVRLIYMHNMDLANMIKSYPRRLIIDNPSIPKDVDEPVELNEGAFELAYQPTSACCCFYWLPFSLRKMFKEKTPELLRPQLELVAFRLKDKMLKEGSIMMSHFSTKSRPHFWRIPNIHPSMSQGHMWTILRLVNRIGNECFPNEEEIDWNVISVDSYCISSSTSSAYSWKPAPEILQESSFDGIGELGDIGSSCIMKS